MYSCTFCMKIEFVCYSSLHYTLTPIERSCPKKKNPSLWLVSCRSIDCSLHYEIIILIVNLILARFEQLKHVLWATLVSCAQKHLNSTLSHRIALFNRSNALQSISSQDGAAQSINIKLTNVSF